MYSVFVLLLLLHCFIFILALLLCYVSRSSLYCDIPSDVCTLCSTLFFFNLYFCYVVYSDHHFTIIYLQTCVFCVWLVYSVFLVITSNSTLVYLYTYTAAMLCIQIITLLWFPFRLVYSVFVLLLLLYCFIFILVQLLCCVSRSSLYCNIPSDFERSWYPWSYYYGSWIYNYLCQSVPITTHFVNLNLDHGEGYHIMW